MKLGNFCAIGWIGQPNNCLKMTSTRMIPPRSRRTSKSTRISKKTCLENNPCTTAPWKMVNNSKAKLLNQTNPSSSKCWLIWKTNGSMFAIWAWKNNEDWRRLCSWAVSSRMPSKISWIGSTKWPKVWTNFHFRPFYLSVASRNMRNSHTHFWVVDWVVENSGGKRCSDKLKNLMKCGTNFRSGSKTRLTTLSNLHTRLLASSLKAGKQLKVLKFIYYEKATKIWRYIQTFLTLLSM